MACDPSVLPFNNAVINGTDVGIDEFVSGSGELVETGSDKATTTADGKIHNVREAINRTSTFEVFGDKTALNSVAGVSTECVLKLDVAVIATFCAIVTAVYSESTRNTTITLQGDATTS